MAMRNARPGKGVCLASSAGTFHIQRSPYRTRLSVIGVREQLPLWPSGHDSPQGSPSRGRTQSLIEASEPFDFGDATGIDMRRRPIASSIPFVAVPDLLLRIGAPSDRTIVWLRCKPGTKPETPPAES
jgi:hypothetical protein